jgi:hypothetical protein
MRHNLRSFVCASVCGAATLAGPSAVGGQLGGSFTNLTTGSHFNLTTAGTADWVHWGENGTLDINRKAGVGPQISDFETLPGSEIGYVSYFKSTNSLATCSWSDGTPALSVTNSTNGVWMYARWDQIGTGFKLSAPADARSRTFKIYVGVGRGEGTLRASLSDGSATGYTNTLSDNTANNRVYVFTYAANSAGQKLNVEWVMTKSQGGDYPHVNLLAAALATPGISMWPLVTLNSVTNGQSFPAGTEIALGAAASDLDGTVTNVSFYVDGNFIGRTTNSPFSITWAGATLGRHNLTAVATDNTGESSVSKPVEIYVFAGANVLHGTLTTYPALQGVSPVDLTTEGTMDWISWGQVLPEDVDRKASGTPIISDYNAGYDYPVGLLETNKSYFAWSWSDGTPTGFNPYTTEGMQFVGTTNGFELQFSTSPQGRRARVYLGDYGSRATVRAWFNTHSGSGFLVPYPLTSVYLTSDGVVDLRYATMEPGQLIVSFSADKLYDVLWGGSRLLSATVQPDNTLFLPLRIVDQQATEQGLAFSFFTQPDHNYFVECTPALPATNWTVVANLPGTGSWLTVTNPPFLDGQGYYRVRAQ